MVIFEHNRHNSEAKYLVRLVFSFSEIISLLTLKLRSVNHINSFIE